LYAIPALSLTKRQVNELNVCWNSVIRRLCGHHRLLAQSYLDWADSTLYT